MYKEYEQVQEAAKILKNKPDDAKANSLVGQYLCFRKGDWEKGLQFVVKGTDPELKKLAKLELSKPRTAANKIQLADSWWSLAIKHTGEAKAQIQIRALHWYKDALPKLSGFTKIRVEKRIQLLYKENPNFRLVDPQSTGIVYLSDLKEFDAKVGFGRFGKKGNLAWLPTESPDHGQRYVRASWLIDASAIQRIRHGQISDQ